MKTNKLGILLLILASMVFMGCSKKGGDSRRVSRAGRTVGNQVVDSNGNFIGTTGYSNSCSGYTGDYSGQVYYDSGYQQDFEYAIAALLTAIGEQPGSIGSQCGMQSGVFFHARVSLDQGFDPSGQYNNQGYISNNGSFSMAIIDSIALQQPDLGPIMIDGYQGSGGYVQGDFASVELYWQGGVIFLEGQIDYNLQIFRGDIGFQNDVHYQGTGVASGYMGFFEVPLCDFFACY